MRATAHLVTVTAMGGHLARRMPHQSRLTAPGGYLARMPHLWWRVNTLSTQARRGAPHRRAVNAPSSDAAMSVRMARQLDG